MKKSEYLSVFFVCRKPINIADSVVKEDNTTNEQPTDELN